MTLADKLELYAKKRGFKRGFEEGLEEGRQVMRDNIIQRLQLHFGVIPKSVQNKVNRKVDYIALMSLFETACTVKTLEEFVAEL